MVEFFGWIMDQKFEGVNPVEYIQQSETLMSNLGKIVDFFIKEPADNTLPEVVDNINRRVLFALSQLDAYFGTSFLIKAEVCNIFLLYM